MEKNPDTEPTLQDMGNQTALLTEKIQLVHINPPAPELFSFVPAEWCTWISCYDRYRAACKLQKDDESDHINDLLLHMGPEVDNILEKMSKTFHTCEEYKEAFNKYFINASKDVEPIVFVQQPKQQSIISMPRSFSFNKRKWKKWIKNYERFRIASHFNESTETEQINMLILHMSGNDGSKISNIFEITGKRYKDFHTYQEIKEWFNAYFSGTKKEISVPAVPPPSSFSFKHAEWKSWILHYNRYRLAVRLHQSDECEQINMLLLHMGGPQELSIIFDKMGKTEEDFNTYQEIKQAMDNFYAKADTAANANSDEEYMDVEDYGSVDMRERECINILLLGETGVGKSTFINSFCNYVQYPDLMTAAQNEVTCLIPTQFTIPDENYEERIIKIGNNKDESTSIGSSATQRTKSYVFQWDARNIRIIDTPGIGDTKGLDQDNINFENILSYIGQYKDLHAICFLLKPNVSRINVYFKYCIQHLLTHLEKSASCNILFVFTNTRSTFYRPAETLSILNKLLKEVETHAGSNNVKIPFSRNNMFCFDNEAFKFLVALKDGIKFTDEEKKDFGSSWNNSVKAAMDMLGYIMGDEMRPGLKPHLVQNTLSINEARRLIISLSKPLADIAQLIADNITIMDRHRDQIMQENHTMDSLQNLLFVPVMNIQCVEMPHPCTVCTASKCSEIIVVSGIQKYHYKQKCHNPCGLQNVPSKMIGSPELVNCAAMHNKKCTQCGCDFSTHMHIYYETRTFLDKLEDTGVKGKLKSSVDQIKQKEKVIEDLIERQIEYEEERAIISKTMAKFACFLKQNSITTYNDAYEEYIQHLLNRERALAASVRNEAIIITLEDMMRRYVEERNILETYIKQSSSDLPVIGGIISVEVILATVGELYALKHNGALIKQMMEQQQKGIKKEHHDSVEYYHEKKTSRNFMKKLSKATKQIADGWNYWTKK